MQILACLISAPNKFMDSTKSLKFIIPVVIAFFLIVFGVFQLYKNKVRDSASSSPIPITSPSITAVVSPSPTPLVMGTIPSNQPAAGSDTVEIKNVGIYVDSPQKNQLVLSPQKVSGKANVFEGNVQIRILDANGNILAKGSATACLGTDACPFETTVTFKKPTTSTGSIELYSPNAVDGAEDYLQSIPIIF